MAACSSGFIKRMAAYAVALTAATAHAADFPVKSVRIVTPFPPGGSVDLVARLLSADLGKVWGQQVIVDNRSGASGRPRAVNRGLQSVEQGPACGMRPRSWS
jgi:tripartite-type tricarboxylate transporter receptor subunit TctC